MQRNTSHITTLSFGNRITP